MIIFEYTDYLMADVDVLCTSETSLALVSFPLM